MVYNLNISTKTDLYSRLCNSLNLHNWYDVDNDKIILVALYTTSGSAGVYCNVIFKCSESYGAVTY